jgi:hypothetical protein
VRAIVGRAVVVDKGGKLVLVLAVGDIAWDYLSPMMRTAHFCQTRRRERGGLLGDDVAGSSSGWVKAPGISWAANDMASSLWHPHPSCSTRGGARQ